MKKIITLSTTLLLAVFVFTVKAQMTTLIAFTGSVSPSYGANPQGNLYYDGTYLYGMTVAGGTNNMGVLFKIMPNGTGYTDMLDFAGVSNGKSPHGSLISDGTFLYGMTQYGGTGAGPAGDGTVFRILPNGTGYFKMYDFDGTTNGKAPFGSLYYDGTYMYGMPQIGGSTNLGTIFTILPTGAYANGYSKLFDFSGTTGATPSGEPEATLTSDGSSLFAVGYNGGKYNKGSLFKINPGTLTFDTLMSFNGANGAYPTNALIYDGAYLYGMTENGGPGACGSGCGTVFKIKPDGSGYDTLMTFRGTNGSLPHGGLYFDGTFLYGAASGGGANGFGILFKIKRDGSGFTDLYDFDGAAHGKAPRGDLISDGSSLYGMTVNGGANNFGVVFKFQYCTLPSVVANASATSICATSSVSLSGSGASTYTWTGGIINGIAFTPAGTATYTVTGTDTLTGCKNTATKVITVNPLPTVIANATANTICAGTSVTLTGAGANTYSWTGGVNNGVAFTPANTATYTVTGTDINNCSNTATKSITINPLPTITATSNMPSVCADSAATLSAIGANTYTWSTNQNGASIVVTPSVTTTYTVTGSDLNNCTNTATLSQVVTNCNTGINQKSDDSHITIYPNPVKVNMLITSGRELGTVTIYNSLGEIIYKEKTGSTHQQIDLSKHAPGMYFLQAGNSLLKIIKE
jgi:uncharacterized repeat protein (TIGR03803 family)